MNSFLMILVGTITFSLLASCTTLRFGSHEPATGHVIYRAGCHPHPGTGQAAGDCQLQRSEYKH